MKPSEEQWNRWIDGDLSPEEADALAAGLQDDPDMADDPAFFSRLSQDLKQTFPAERTPPFADFFNSHLQKQLRDLDEAEDAESEARSSPWRDWLRLSWLAPLGAAALLVFTLVQIGVLGGKGSQGSQISYAYVPDSSMVAKVADVSFDDGANAVVVRMQGMKALPDGFDLILTDAGLPVGAEGPMVADVTTEFPFVGPRLHYTSY